MANIEVEPEDFLKGLRLLHSRSPDSSDELKKLLDLYHSKKVNHAQDSKRSKESIANVFSSIKSLNQGLKSAEKKSKVFDDDSEATDVEDNESMDAQETTTNHCVVCKQQAVSNPNNRLLECQECKSCYHVDCHKPSVLKKDINDPRSIWYCFKCKNSGKKLHAQKSMSSGKIIIGKGTNVLSSNPVGSSSTMSINTSREVYKIGSLSDGGGGGGKSTMAGGLKRLTNKITGAGSSSSPYSVIKPTMNQSAGLNRISSVNSITNKSKTSNMSMHSANYSSSSSSSSSSGISSLDKRLASIKKAKSGSKF